MIKTKVIHVITKMELGGAQENTLFTVSHLDTEKFQTYLVTGPGGELFDEACASSSTFVVSALIREIRLGRDVKALFQLRSIFKKIKADNPTSAPIIVHTHSSKAGILARWAARLAKIPIIIHSIHGFGFNDYQPRWLKSLFILLEKITAHITTHFIAVSQANINLGVALKIFQREKAMLIRSGIDIDKYQYPSIQKEAFRQQINIPSEVPLVAMIACFKPQKAPLDFIAVCAQVGRIMPHAHFLLIGDGELRDCIEEEIETHQLQDRVHLLGWRQDIPEILNAIDVLALTSRWEGLPRVIPEAMAAGIPAVVTSVDGVPEAIRDGINGYLLLPGDINGIAEKIIFLLQHSDQAREMGKRGQDMVEEFDVYRMIRQQEMLYDTLLAPTGVGSNTR
jgi:glycosyltransferase involved in cell wall biosynthesis